MKLYFILLINVLLLVSCNDCSVHTIEVPVDLFKNIKFKHNLQDSNFMTDADTLKIEILDTNLFEKNPFKEISLRINAILSSSATSSINHTYEIVNSDLHFVVNPNNEFEMWIMGFKPNLDSNRSIGVGKYFNYNLHIDYSKVSEYYKKSFLAIFVESTTE